MIRSLFPAAFLAFALLPACQTAAPTTTTTATTTEAAPATTPPAPLRNTRWVLRQLAGQAVPAPADREPYLLLREAEFRAEGNGGCNRFSGPFQLPAAGQLQLGPLLSTRMACLDPGATATETAFLRALEATRTYRISGDTLQLYGEPAARPAAVLHAVYLR